VNDDEDGQCSFGTRQWDASAQSGALSAARRLVEVHCAGMGRHNAAEKRPWERTMERAVQRLNDDARSDSKFHRPPAKTDRLYAVLERGSEPIFVKHPMPDAGNEHLYRENLPNIRCGAVASGRAVARDAALRTQVELSDNVNTRRSSSTCHPAPTTLARLKAWFHVKIKLF